MDVAELTAEACYDRFPTLYLEDGTPVETGIWLDSARGIYMGEAVQGLAEEYGWRGEVLDSTEEFYHEAWGEALGHMADLDLYLDQPGEHRRNAREELDPIAIGFWQNENGDFGLWFEEAE